MPLPLLVAATVFAVLAWGVLWPNSSLFIPTVGRGSRRERSVALTFDDGPDPRITPLVLDLLARHSAPATFFCVGSSARRHPELIARMVREGHLVAYHSLEHDWGMNFWLPRRVLRSLARGERVLRRLTGFAPRFYRAPVGIKSPAHALAGWRLGIVFVGWTRSARDGGRFLLRPEVLERMGNRSRPGDILLCHDGKWDVGDDASVRATREVFSAYLPGLIERLRARGLQPVRLDRLLGAPAAADQGERRLRRHLFAKGWLASSRRIFRHLATEHTSPLRLALAAGLGVFVGSSPLFGLHAALGLAFAVRLRLNKLAVFLGTNISNPVTGPLVLFVNVQTGCRLLTGQWLHGSLAQVQSAGLLSLGKTLLLYWVAGFPVASSLLALLTTAVLYPIFRAGRPSDARGTSSPGTTP